MNQKKLFEILGAPLKNFRRSWGSIRSDQVVFLRVWQDEVKTIEGKKFYKIGYISKNVPVSQLRLSDKERHQHIQLIENGCQVYMVVCSAKDENVSAKRIKSCNTDFVFLGGTLYKDAENIWLEIKQQLPVQDIVLNLNREPLLPIQEKFPETSQLVPDEIFKRVIEEPNIVEQDITDTYISEIRKYGWDDEEDEDEQEHEKHTIELITTNLENTWMEISRKEFLKLKREGLEYADEITYMCNNGFSIQACYDNSSALFVDGKEIEEFHQIVKEAIASDNRYDASTKNTSTTKKPTSKKKRLNMPL